MSRIRSILESHALNLPEGRALPAGVPLRVRPDLLLVDAVRGRLALGRFAASGASAPRIEVVAASDRPEAPAWSGGDPEWSEFADLARACGVRLAPPRAGDMSSIALDMFGAPGRMLVAVSDLAAAGALGALAWKIGELEAAALMAGEPLEFEARSPLRVQLDGVLPARVEGHDVACALVSGWPGAWADALVEFQGEGLTSLSVSDRAVVARGLSRAGARAVLFPSDDATREFLRDRGREADWRRTEPSNGDGPPLVLELGWVVPQAMAGLDSRGSAALLWWSGAAVGEVTIGREASFEDLTRLGALLVGRAIADGVWMSVGPTSGPLVRAAEATGLRAALLASGVHWRRDDDAGRPCRRSDALRLHFGSLPADAGADDWSASLQACAAAACAGAIEEPHRWPDARNATRGDGALAPSLISIPPSLGSPEAAVTEGGARPASRASAPLCGPVFARWPRDLDADALLPPGPRVRALLDRPARLTPLLLPGATRLAGAAGRAPRWLVVWGALSGLDDCEAGLLALRELGVRAVLAGAVEPRTRRRCSEAGLLAMRVAHVEDLAEIGPGDELELVGGLDLATVERSRVVRDLTRARALVVVPELDAREWSWVRTGARFLGTRAA